jgi:hypothetical protein
MAHRKISCPSGLISEAGGRIRLWNQSAVASFSPQSVTGIPLRTARPWMNTPKCWALLWQVWQLLGQNKEIEVVHM